MSRIAEKEIQTQKRLIELFKNELEYIYVGDWKERPNNSNIEEDFLYKNLKKRGYDDIQITKTIDHLNRKSNNLSNNLYQRNKDIYELMRYGISIKTDASKLTETVHLIDWKNPTSNDFIIAEEVTLKGNYERRPDLVLYINGIAFCTIELKRSTVSINEGIRQSISNQQNRFNEWFYSTIQFVIAGNDSEGLRYGTIQTPETFFLNWKENENENEGYKLDKYILKMFSKSRVLDLMLNFIIYDGGIKKVPRVNQYFAVKSAQEYVKRHEGGIIWHTQGSGKSIIMVFLTKWILENNPKGRVVIITDRNELDKQIEDIFSDSGISIERAKSGKDLVSKLKSATPRILCSLIHKFGKRDIDNFDIYIKSLNKNHLEAEGDIFVLVDECHRTQSGKLHKIMKAYLPDATFFGFTGTPLLKRDKTTSKEVFGGYIHKYLLDEAVKDKVILDILYEARDINQYLGSRDKIDTWFEVKTKGLNQWQKSTLKKKWTSLQTVLSSESRVERIVDDIIFDFSIKPRLSSDKGTAILVANSIFEACKYLEYFNKTEMKGKCALITSYNPHVSDITLEDTGANTETDKEYIFKIYEDLLENINPKPGKNKVETYEDIYKSKFIKEPHNTKLLIVVDKLLTGFDAPSCTYLYIDKSMKDHSLFQAICRTNRIDGEDKDYGYIVDYKDLFKKVENAIAVYSSELDSENLGKKNEINIYDRLHVCKNKLDEILESLEKLCQPLGNNKDTIHYINFFCGNSENPNDLKENKLKRETLYKLTASMVRTYANLANELILAGYTESESIKIKGLIKNYKDLRDIIRNASGEYLDLKTYEADMRHLIDTYIEADEAKKISNFENLSLVELIVKSGIAEMIQDKLENYLKNKNEISETLENNFRNTIDKNKFDDLALFEKISLMLNDVILQRKNKSIEYEDYLKKMEILAKKITQSNDENFPPLINKPELRMLYNNLFNDEELAIKLDNKLKKNAPNDWRNVLPKEQIIKQTIFEVMPNYREVERLFEIIKQQKNY